MQKIRTLKESVEEFNELMNPYVVMVVRTEKCSYEIFRENTRLIVPEEKIIYTPPAWAGVSYSVDFIGMFPNIKGIRRTEKIPEINPSVNYLIYDDYASTGNTPEIAMIRLLETGVNLENIWCSTKNGNNESSFERIPLLDKGTEWHSYFLRQLNPERRVLKELGFKFPEFPAQVL